MYKRALNLKKMSQKKSYFLLGPRATGKSWLIKNELPDAQIFNLLDTSIYDRFIRRPSALAEAIVRRVDSFARFLDSIGLISGEELNYQQVASDAGVPPRTVAHFVEVLKDTLLELPIT